MKRFWPWLAVAAVGAAVAVWWSRAGARPVQVTVVSPEPRELDLSFTAEGFVVGRTYELSPESPGRVVWVGVQEGEEVLPGQVLVRLDSGDLDDALRQARAAQRTAELALSQAQAGFRAMQASVKAGQEKARAGLKEAEANLKRVRRGPAPQEIERAELEVRRARATADEMKRRLERAERLYAQGAIPGVEVDAARLAWETAEVAASSAEQALAQLQHEPRPEDIEAALAAVASAQATLSQAKEGDKEVAAQAAQVETVRGQLQEARTAVAKASGQVRKITLTSPVRGVVVRRSVEVGMMAGTGAPALQIATEEDLHVEAEIRSEDLSTVRSGMEVEVSLPSQAGRPYSGVVTKLAAAAETKPDAAIRTRIVRAYIKVAGMDRQFVPGLEVDVSGAEKISAALTLPSDCILIEGDSPQVWVVESGRAALRTVKLGYADVDRTEVLSGLKPSDKVILTGKDSLKEGQKVELASRAD